MDILKQELYMSDHMHAMICDQVIIILHLIFTDKFHAQVIIMLHLIFTDKFHDQVIIMLHLIFTDKFHDQA